MMLSRSRSVIVALPSWVFDTLVVLKVTSSTAFCAAVMPAQVAGDSQQLAESTQVYIVRLTAGRGLWTPGVVGGLLPRRSTSAAAPFSTCGPSGESENRLVPEHVHWPALPFWNSQ